MRYFGSKSISASFFEIRVRRENLDIHGASLHALTIICLTGLISLAVQQVPTMGDSISEGVVETYTKGKWTEDSMVGLTYWEFVLGVGEYVEADEVVARIETDKVTVDILS